MNRKWIGWACVGMLLAVGMLTAPGCGEEAGQPSRESIKAPREGGGVMDTGGEKGKSKAAGKLGGKADL